MKNAFSTVSVKFQENIIYEQRLLYIAQKSISFDDIVFFFRRQVMPGRRFIFYFTLTMQSFVIHTLSSFRFR